MSSWLGWKAVPAADGPRLSGLSHRCTHDARDPRAPTAHGETYSLPRTFLVMIEFFFPDERKNCVFMHFQKLPWEFNLWADWQKVQLNKKLRD